MTLTSLRDVLADQIGDLQSAEGQLVEALPKMADAANDEGLRAAFMHHLEETREHARRLDQVSEMLGSSIPAETCEAMRGLIREGEKVIGESGDPTARDAALIAAAQRVEHYEIAAYGSARALAKELGMGDVARALGETLDEEAAADKTLTGIATGGLFSSGLNKAAVAH
jgi:ferritin-like metal-binding protein YciE